ncbi:hypothetical protein V1264_010053 [Littorina saxatilis]|uniref:Uncharacterized protein n=1 Tax=Littorina saxatilis TaxID=31220 RepID=A0AAN9FZS9_9CAEN
MEHTIFVLVLFGVLHFLPQLCADNQFSTSDCFVAYNDAPKTLTGECYYEDQASTDRSTNCTWLRTNPGRVTLPTERTETGQREDGTYFGICAFTQSSVERWQSGVHTYSVEFYTGNVVIVSLGPTSKFEL